jgi:hypothetical protein
MCFETSIKEKQTFLMKLIYEKNIHFFLLQTCQKESCKPVYSSKLRRDYGYEVRSEILLQEALSSHRTLWYNFVFDNANKIHKPH